MIVNLDPLPPDLPGHFWGLCSCSSCSSLTEIFTALLALLVKVNLSDSRVLGKQQSQLASYQWQFVDLNEEREWTMHSHLNYYGYSLIQKYVMGSSASATGTT